LLGAHELPTHPPPHRAHLLDVVVDAVEHGALLHDERVELAEEHREVLHGLGNALQSQAQARGQAQEEWTRAPPPPLSTAPLLRAWISRTRSSVSSCMLAMADICASLMPSSSSSSSPPPLDTPPAPPISASMDVLAAILFRSATYSFCSGGRARGAWLLQQCTPCPAAAHVNIPPARTRTPHLDPPELRRQLVQPRRDTALHVLSHAPLRLLVS